MIHPIGRPMAYTDPGKLQATINAYFDKCDQTMITKQFAHSKGITKVETPTPYTMAGLAAALNVSRETLNQYKYIEPFSDIIIHARERVHQQNLNLALVGCHDSKIAALNLASNYGYSTKESIEHSGPGGGPIEYTDTERAARLAAILGAVKARKAAEGE